MFLLALNTVNPRISPGFTPLHITKGFYVGGLYNRTKKNASKQAMAALIKIRFALAGS